MSNSEVMIRAGELRREGYDASEALSQAWEEELGEEEDDYMDDNPIKGDWSKYATWAGLGYGAWVLINYFQTKTWNFMPWKSLAGMRRQIVAPQNRMLAAPVRQANPSFGATNIYSPNEGTMIAPTPYTPAQPPQSEQPGDYRGTHQLLPPQAKFHGESVNIIYP